jgi:hypothetical protein
LDEGHRRRDGEKVTEGKRQRRETEEERRRERNRGDRHRGRDRNEETKEGREENKVGGGKDIRGESEQEK